MGQDSNNKAPPKRIFPSKESLPPLPRPGSGGDARVRGSSADPTRLEAGFDARFPAGKVGPSLVLLWGGSSGSAGAVPPQWQSWAQPRAPGPAPTSPRPRLSHPTPRQAPAALLPAARALAEFLPLHQPLCIWKPFPQLCHDLLPSPRAVAAPLPKAPRASSRPLPPRRAAQSTGDEDIPSKPGDADIPAPEPSLSVAGSPSLPCRPSDAASSTLGAGGDVPDTSGSAARRCAGITGVCEHGSRNRSECSAIYEASFQ